MTRNNVATEILKTFSAVGQELPEAWFELTFCATPWKLVDDMINELMDAGYIRSTVIVHSHAAGLVLTEAGARALHG